MTRYYKIAAKANRLISQVVKDYGKTTEEKAELTILLGQIYNLGIRTAPRPPQTVVRVNAVRAALDGLNCSVTTTPVETTGYNGKPYTFQAMVISPKDPVSENFTVDPEDGDDSEE